jgi:hypothetical protein
MFTPLSHERPKWGRARSPRACLVAALLVWRRRDYRSKALVPHNVPFTLLGGGLLWFRWFGLNAGSALAANQIAALAFTATMLAPAGTLVVWVTLDAIRSHRSTAVGAATAIVVGLLFGNPGQTWDSSTRRAVRDPPQRDHELRVVETRRAGVPIARVGQRRGLRTRRHPARRRSVRSRGGHGITDVRVFRVRGHASGVRLEPSK